VEEHQFAEDCGCVSDSPPIAKPTISIVISRLARIILKWHTEQNAVRAGLVSDRKMALWWDHSRSDVLSCRRNLPDRQNQNAPRGQAGSIFDGAPKFSFF
jgi:hypothetical protein